MIGKCIRADSRNPSQSVHGNGNRHHRLFRQPTPKSINIWTVQKTTGKSEISQTEYDSQVANWQRGQVLLNSIAAELSAPTQSSAGIAAATASPMISYKIGRYFKSKNTEGSSAHILVHAVLGAAAGDNNALAGAINAGGAEAAVPVISNWLYGEIDGSALTAERKETVSAITNLLGAATGATIVNSSTNATQGSLNAQNTVENNYLTSKQLIEIDKAHHECGDEICKQYILWFCSSFVIPQ